MSMPLIAVPKGLQERKCPGQMAAFDYPASCREKLNIWPAFYANYGRLKHFAKKKYNGVDFCGFAPVHLNGSVPAGNFTDLSRKSMDSAERALPQTGITSGAGS